MLEILSTGLSKIVVSLTAILLTLTASPEQSVNVPHDNSPPQENPSSTVEPVQADETGTSTIAAEVPPRNFATSQLTYIDTAAAHEKLKSSLVNIYCTIQTSKKEVPLTASGVVIDPRGVVLTNAHVAQYVLLSDHVADDAIECSVRTGSPAREKYQAEVLYVSPEWIEDHAEDILNPKPTGNGENDYAFLLLGKSIDEDEVRPKEFSFIPPTTSEKSLLKGAPILIGSYPAGILDTLSIKSVLFSHTLKTDIKDLRTFKGNTPDVISTGGTYLSQTGSSGGAVLDKGGRLIGVFVTSTLNEDFSKRDLRAITLSHIDRNLREYAKLSLPGLLASDVKEVSEEFREEVVPILADILLDEIGAR